MLNSKFNNKLNQKGIASIEIIPILVIFILLINFAMGFFGVIHSGILNSIGARNYAFETFRNRSNLNFLRDTGSSVRYTDANFRYHGIVGENHDNNAFVATLRPINFISIGQQTDILGKNEHTTLKSIAEGKRSSESGAQEGVDPVWIVSAYGICLNSNCEGN